MTIKENNYAFIDGNNIYLGMLTLGWKLDFSRFRYYLKNKYSIEKAFYFIGYVEAHKQIYDNLKQAGYELIFKTTYNRDGAIKGNCDAELVLHCMIEKENFNKAVLVSSDGDFSCLVKHLEQTNQLLSVIVPRRKECSHLLIKEAAGKINELEFLRKKLEYIKKRTP